MFSLKFNFQKPLKLTFFMSQKFRNMGFYPANVFLICSLTLLSFNTFRNKFEAPCLKGGLNFHYFNTNFKINDDLRNIKKVLRVSTVQYFFFVYPSE